MEEELVTQRRAKRDQWAAAFPGSLPDRYAGAVPDQHDGATARLDETIVTGERACEFQGAQGAVDVQVGWPGDEDPIRDDGPAVVGLWIVAECAQDAVVALLGDGAATAEAVEGDVAAEGVDAG